MFISKLLNLLTYCTALLLAGLLAAPAAAQQPGDSGQETEAAAAGDAAVDEAPVDESTTDDATTDDADATAEDIEDADLDEQTYEEDDDDFIPTEEIPADEPIPFPSNI